MDCDCKEYCKRSGIKEGSGFWIPYGLPGLMPDKLPDCKMIEDRTIQMTPRYERKDT